MSSLPISEQPIKTLSALADAIGLKESIIIQRISEQPIKILPVLANAIGLKESIIIQRIDIWLDLKREEKETESYKEGKYWVYNSYSQWSAQFPFWCQATVTRKILKLEKLKLLISGNFNKDPLDRTKWYTIDYKVLDALLEE